MWAWKFLYWIITWIFVALSSLLDRFWVLGIPEPTSTILRIIGLLVVAYSILLSGVAGRTLKKYGHMEIRGGFRAPDRLVTEGIYSCMRHPNHFGLALMPIGIAMLLASQTALLFSGWGFGAAMFFLVRFEEPENMSRFGESYVEYVKKTPPFNLSLKCLSRGIKALRAKIK